MTTEERIDRITRAINAQYITDDDGEPELPETREAVAADLFAEWQRLNIQNRSEK